MIILLKLKKIAFNYLYHNFKWSAEIKTIINLNKPYIQIKKARRKNYKIDKFDPFTTKQAFNKAKTQKQAIFESKVRQILK